VPEPPVLCGQRGLNTGKEDKVRPLWQQGTEGSGTRMTGLLIINFTKLAFPDYG